jgi:thiosulfate/3-mercaptopyruvate sulfurtransferase
MPKGTLLEVEELREMLDQKDVVIVDTRDPEAYVRGHIPGAINVHEIFTYLALSENGGYPAMERFFEEVFRKAGVRATDKVVVYEDAMDNGYGQSCRGWFFFNYLGHSHTSVLHGGFRAWKSKEYPTDIQMVTRERSEYKVKPNPNLIVTTEQMIKAIDDPAIVILDVRDYAEWIGANSSPYGYDYAPRKGHIPNAIWIEWYRLMRHKQGIPWFRTPEEILSVLEQLEITVNTPVYLYCFKGARTSNTMMAMKNAGVKDVRNYLMSWNEWSRQPDLPIEEGYS